MGKTPNERVRGIEAKAADLQARFHALLERAHDEARRAVSAPPKPAVGSFVAISRQAGSGGAEVGRMVAEKLGWSFLGRELVEATAERLRVSPRMLDLLDETRSNWFSDSVLTLLEPRLTIQDSYVSLVGKVMLLAAHDGKVVIVGRGAPFVLPRERGLAVRIKAPLGARIARVAEHEGLDARAAARRVEELENSRRQFIRRHFRADVDDPSHYDLVIDTEAFELERCAELVCRAVELRGLVKR